MRLPFTTGCLLLNREGTGLAALTLHSGAMALRFLLGDHGVRPDRLQTCATSVRWVLTAAVPIRLDPNVHHTLQWFDQAH